MLDPKALAGMDPKMLQTYGLDPKWFDPKNMGMHPKMLQGMDPKLLQSMGINLKTLGMDSKTSASSSTSAAAETGSKGSKITCFGRN